MIKVFPKTLVALKKKLKEMISDMSVWNKKYKVGKQNPWRSKLLRDANRPYCGLDFLELEKRIKRLEGK